MPKLELGLPLLNSDVEDFKKVVFSVSQLVNDGSANILFGLEKDVQIEIDNSELVRYEVDEGLFNEVVNLEFLPLLEAILEGTDEQFVEIQVRQNKSNTKSKDSESKKVDYEKSIKKKVEYIKQIIINDKLVSRYIIKATTKRPKIKNIEWEINRKTYDKNKREIDAKYATLNIKFSKELGGENSILKIFQFMESESKVEELIFDCDENDIEYLIKILNSVKGKLIKSE